MDASTRPRHSRRPIKVDLTIALVHRNLENPIALVGAAGFGVSLYLIHIYVTPIKRFLQLLWATGVAGGAFLMATQVCPRPQLCSLHESR